MVEQAAEQLRTDPEEGRIAENPMLPVINAFREVFELDPNGVDEAPSKQKKPPAS